MLPALLSPSVPWLASIAALGLIFLCGAAIHSDLLRRSIPNSICAGIAVLAIIYAMGTGGWSGMSQFGARLVIAFLIALPLILLFLIRALGGGDVKLLAALLLWVPAMDMPMMFGVIAITGAVIAIVLKLLDRVFCSIRADAVPYGIAIVTGALCVLLPHFGGLATAMCMPSL